MHPRTQQRIRGWGLNRGLDGVKVINPAGYLDFLALMKSAVLAITDSGGVQEETTYLGIPCLTVRSNTERPITIEQGTNRLVQGKRRVIVEAAHEMITSHRRSQCKIKYWDGQTSKRIVSVFQNL
jgi:UDP-N-acetylglucosamine 2-epimerase (non-hydrolysing)